MTQALIAFALLAWLLQIAFGWWQLQRFNRAFDGLCRLGAVGVGRSGGRFRREWCWRWPSTPIGGCAAACYCAA